MPARGSAVASATNRAIFAMPKSPFSMGTQTALRSPVRTPSCSVKMLQVATHAVKTSPAVALPSSVYDDPQCLTVSRKGIATATDATALEAYARRTSAAVYRPDCGMNLVSAPVRLTAVNPDSRFIAEYAADARPTSATSYRRAASSQ